VLVAALFAGPSRLAVWFRTSVRRVANWLGNESDRAGWRWLGPSTFVVRYKTALRVVVAAAAFALLFFWNRPTPAVIFWIALATLALLAVVEFFGREPFVELRQPEAGRAATQHQ
jgi:ABC-type glycerol-3-phosphate transport system permease component